MRRRRRPGSLDLPMARFMPIGDRLILAQTQMLMVARRGWVTDVDYAEAAADWSSAADQPQLLAALHRTVVPNV